MSSKRHRLLVVEDDIGLQRQLTWALEAFEVHCAGTRAEAVAALQRLQPSVVLLDLGLPPEEQGVEEGFATIVDAHRIAPRAKIIVLTGRTGREHAVRAVSLGAHEFCEKPVDIPLLPTLVARAVRRYELEAEADAAAVQGRVDALQGIYAASESMLEVCRSVERLAPTSLTVLLLGESGTGKERLARALHQLSSRARKPLVAINCAAIPETLLESELFGHERGAFTGAVGRKIGHIERADGGTLFLDEIGDMPLALQAKVLRFLQERVIERVGGRQPIAVDLRVVAATNQVLDTAVARGAFRLDLYHRISEVAVTIPPLRERGSDSVLIATQILQSSHRSGLRAARFAPDAVAAIESHSWPGNVRELENRVNRAAILAEGPAITAEDLGLAAGEAPGTELLSLRKTRRRAENQAVQRAIALTGGNIAKAARMLGITRPTIYEVLGRMKRAERED
ncbi:MAG: PEP-CTERM-box response regulator transcription factor [Steroidobacteraceae bacterium]